jgi:hypothetical protein
VKQGAPYSVIHEGSNAESVGLGGAEFLFPVGGLENLGGKILSFGTKVAARDAVEALGLDAAQAAGARSAIGRATSTTTIHLLEGDEGAVVVRLERAGRNGSQVIESTISRTGAKSVVQRAYDALGNLVHVDPKTP